ncbi:general odorant-binding protein 56h-like [Haematobia irritans]|uniref:general odorant-binding protein 56h-like n=1 Tax=Haematobia irritans TaxID=7368 RepID=UPI003F4F4EAC
MKVLHIFGIIFYVLCCTTVKAISEKEVDNLIKICQQEVPSTKEEIQNFLKSNMDPANATDSIKCHSKCVLEKQGVFSRGVFDEKAFLKLAENSTISEKRKNEIMKVIEECKIQRGTDDCETAFKITMCLQSKNDLIDD